MALNTISGQISDLVIALVNMSGLIGTRSLEYDKDTKKSQVLFDITHLKTDIGYFSSHLPCIVKPLKITKKTVDVLSIVQKKIFMGSSDIKWSQKAIDILNIINAKKFKVNKRALDIVLNAAKKADEGDKAFIDICADNFNYYSQVTLKELESQILSLEYRQKKTKFDFEAYNLILKNERTIKSTSYIYEEARSIALEVIGASIEDITDFQFLKELKVKQADFLKLNALFNYKVNTASLLEGFSLFYHNEYDYRTRMYTRE